MAEKQPTPEPDPDIITKYPTDRHDEPQPGAGGTPPPQSEPAGDVDGPETEETDQ